MPYDYPDWSTPITPSLSPVLAYDSGAGKPMAFTSPVIDTSGFQSLVVLVAGTGGTANDFYWCSINASPLAVEPLPGYSITFWDANSSLAGQVWNVLRVPTPGASVQVAVRSQSGTGTCQVKVYGSSQIVPAPSCGYAADLTGQIPLSVNTNTLPASGTQRYNLPPSTNGYTIMVQANNAKVTLNVWPATFINNNWLDTQHLAVPGTIASVSPITIPAPGCALHIGMQNLDTVNPQSYALWAVPI